MNIETGSIANFFYKAKNCMIYDDGLPEDFEIPSLYIPNPFRLPNNFSNIAYEVVSSVQVKVFGDSDNDAYEHAQLLQSKILENRNLIPIIDIDGNIVEGKWLRVRKCETSQIEDCVQQISLEWSFIYGYEREESETITNFNFDITHAEVLHNDAQS